MKFEKLITNLDNLGLFQNINLEEAVKNPDLVKEHVLIFDLRQTGVNAAKVFEYKGYYEKWVEYDISLKDGEVLRQSKRLYSKFELEAEFAEFFEKIGLLVKN